MDQQNESELFNDTIVILYYNDVDSKVKSFFLANLNNLKFGKLFWIENKKRFKNQYIDLYAEKLHTKKKIWERISPVYFYFSWPINFMIKHLHYIHLLYMAIVQVQGRWPIFIIILSYYHILLYISLAQIFFLIFIFKIISTGFSIFFKCTILHYLQAVPTFY
jgi:hypothetical protein